MMNKNMGNKGLVIMGIVFLITSLMREGIWSYYFPYSNLLVFFIGILAVYVGLGRNIKKKEE